MECPEKIDLTVRQAHGSEPALSLTKGRTDIKNATRMRRVKMKRWMKGWMFSAVPAVLCLMLSHLAPAANLPPSKDDVLPTINFTVPKNPDERAYLGLSGSGRFKIPQIKAQVVIVEIFSMYCPVCQKDAPRVNEMYQAIEKNPDFKTRIKLVGIGAGNSPYEVEVFKKTYQVPFPLFADGDFTVHKAIGEVRTPHFIAIKITEGGTHQVVLSQSGDFQGAEAFLEKVLKTSGLK
jgi:peroxiredoxin